MCLDKLNEPDEEEETKLAKLYFQYMEKGKLGKKKRVKKR